ncbi:hypothetical protein BDV98DRAFT_343431 [Pterulicium gracile]|uniref:ABM domain-containing protein n=1 Tax=Pterulicium gracile TaxID=1884261 RepID=A0A5C3Q3E3_9AGAR|nr:hypothetical protein BDV98DRAFT_343431 [Pterula gracilis]
MLELVPTIPGFKGMDVAYLGLKEIMVTYWDSVEAIKTWRRNMEHLHAQKKGKNGWFDGYRVIIAETKKEYGFVLPELIPESGKVPVSSKDAKEQSVSVDSQQGVECASGVAMCSSGEAESLDAKHQI